MRQGAKATQQRVVALKFKMGDDAPEVLAKGRGLVADNIIAKAREKGIPLYEDPDLVEILSQLDIGERISPELYQAVAEVLIFIYKMNMKRQGKTAQEYLAHL